MRATINRRRRRRPHHLDVACRFASAAMLCLGLAHADDPQRPEATGYVPGVPTRQSLGLSPYSPQGTSALPGGVTPAFGAPVSADDYKFDFHGYMQAPLRAGIGSRDAPTADQHKLQLHTPPLVPGEYGFFDYTGSVPSPWVQLNFSYGNSRVSATAIVAAWRTSEDMVAVGNFEPASQVGVNNAFLTYTPGPLGPLRVKVKLGAFPDRYGAMAEYDEGRYGTAVIGKIFGVGETITAELTLADTLSLQLEQGIKGNFDKPPVGLVQDNSNQFARSWEGATFAHHAHAGIAWNEIVQAGLHYIRSSSQDDRAVRLTRPVDDPATMVDESKLATYDGTLADGSLTVLGAEAAVRGGRFGRFYAGVARTTLSHTETLSGLVQVLNTGSGYSFMERYLGQASHGNGRLFTLGSEYTISFGKLTRYPEDFWGEGTDVLVSVFGMYNRVASDDAAYDGLQSYKLGTEVTYAALPWLAVSGRVDRLVPDTRNSGRSFAVVSPKLVFRTSWQTREALTLQYSKWFYGSSPSYEGDRIGLMNNPGQKLDDQMVAVYASMWW
jgi:hypothetical protein